MIVCNVLRCKEAGKLLGVSFGTHIGYDELLHRTTTDFLLYFLFGD